MDPKQGGQKPLDPNLQAAYDRVMGVSLTGEPTPPQPAASTSGPTTPVPAEPTVPAAPTTAPTEPAIPTPVPPMPEPTNPATPTPPPVNPVPDLPIMPTPGGSTPPSPVPDLPTTPPAGPAPIPSSNLPTTPPVLPTAPNDTADEPIPTSPSPSMESLSATIAMPQVIPHDTETVKIGMGGSPAGADSKAKKKGISPVILIVGAFAFLLIYAMFWVRFFNYSLPFLPK